MRRLRGGGGIRLALARMWQESMFYSVLECGVKALRGGKSHSRRCGVKRVALRDATGLRARVDEIWERMKERGGHDGIVMTWV